MERQPLDPFRIVVPRTAPCHHHAALIAARPFLSWLLALPTYRQLYQLAQADPADAFCTRALRALNISLQVDTGASFVPDSGPLIVVANHPHGAIDGLLLADVIGQRRADVRVLTNHLLAPIPALSELCLFVDAFGRHGSPERSRGGLRAAVKWLERGHALVVFPAGEVAHRFVERSMTPVDATWRDTAGRLALKTGASVVPAFIEGRNSRSFYRVGGLHSGFRTLLLARELLRQRGRRIVVRFGRPIALATHVDVRDGASATTLMRAAVDRLATPAVSAVAQPPVPVLHGPAASALMSDVQALGKDNRLLRSGRFDVFSARAAQIPNLLLEIGRLRELTFRTVGEGTGKAVDLDRFDEHYLHLFVWNHDTREVVGAYRIGAIDGILASHGVNGLYTSTLFRYDQRLLTRLGPALELGRSFVRAEYQRSNALLLLWKGIAQYVAQRQRYRVLFGPVSISSRYGDSSQQLLRSFLAQNAYHRELGELVAALTPPPELPTAAANAPMSGNLRDLDKLIAGQEPDGKGMPVLLRQYLRLNAKLLGFNVDPAFGDALDALMMVDLADVDAAILKRYFGAEEAELLLRTARRSCPEAA